MTKAEKKIILFLESHKELLYFIIITLLGMLLRYHLRYYTSLDANNCLLPWYDIIKEKGGLRALDSQVGNYGIPYQFLIALMTYIPIHPLYAYKILSVFFDFCLALICAKFVCALKGEKSGYLFSTVYGIVLLLPTVAMNSALWAQCDSIYTFFIITALYCLYKEKNVKAFVFVGIAFAFKLQTVFIVPFIVIYIFLEKKAGFLWGFVSLLAFYVMQIPGFFMRRSLLDPFTVYQSQIEEYDSMWLNFPGFWVLTGDNISLRYFAITLTVGILGTGLYVLMHGKIRIDGPKIFMEILIWSVWTCLLFLPAMHERYGYLLDILSVIAVFLEKKKFPFAAVAVLCSLAACSNLLFGSNVDIRFLSIAYTAAYLCYTYILFIKSGIRREHPSS